MVDYCSCNSSYNTNSTYTNKRKSKCSRGALLGEVGSACGMNCNRKCCEAN